MIIDRDALLRRFVAMQYARNDMAFTRGTFRVRGDTIEIIPVRGARDPDEMFGDEIESLAVLHPLTGDVIDHVDHTLPVPGVALRGRRGTHEEGDRLHRGRAR